MEGEYSQEIEDSDNNQDSSSPSVIRPEYNNYSYEERQRINPEYPEMSRLPQGGNGMHMMNTFPNQMGFSPYVVNLESISNMLHVNRKELLRATNHSNEGEIEDAIKSFSEIQKNLVFLADAADLQSNSRFVLRQERELVSQKDLAYFNAKFPIQDSIYGHNDAEKKKDTKKKKAKQVKKPWTLDEEEKFLEGLKKFGNNVRKISVLIESRTVVQVRSHLQKYKIKQEKVKQKKLENQVKEKEANQG
mmetsp:Transcript_22075/g.19645  ORF Transcript_22075/g.19645 Transcript_22075/m.19645 type:complete len:247 (-) Transcript_22075:122-862(-)